MLSRRELLAAFGGLVTTGCTRAGADPTSCMDTTSLSVEEVQARTSLAYVDLAGDPNKTCAACQQYVVPTQRGACGGCKLLRGPIHPKGSCKAFAPKG